MKEREQWGSRVGFIMAAVGSAIGLGNIWRFPYQAYENGGGAFLVPYFVALFTAGIPILILEFGLGHKFKGSAPTAFKKLTTKHGNTNSWEWLGWFQSFISGVISTFYSVIVAWTICFAVFSLYGAWGDNSEAFFYNDFLKLNGSNPFDFGGFNYLILGVTALVWIICWFILFKGVKKGIESANKIFMPTLIVLILVLTISSVTSKGAAMGLDLLFKPNLDKLFDIKVWSAAYGQIFFSLSVGFAVMISYSSYLPKKTDIVNNGFMTGLLNCGFSILSGIMIFATLGSMAYAQGVPVSEVVKEGPGLAFVVIPEALANMPFPRLFGPLFFLSLTIAGLSSLISILEALVIAIIDKFHFSRSKVITAVALCGFLVSTIFTTYTGLLALDIVDYFINNFGIIFSALCELFLLAWIYKLTDIQMHINPISDFKVGTIWKICLMVLAPVIIGSMAMTNISKELILGDTYGGYSGSAVLVFGWLVLLSVFIVSLVIQKIPGKKGE